MKYPVIKRVGLGVFVISAVFALPAFLSGEGAEEVVEQLAGGEDRFIETHETLASIYVWAMGGLGLLALLTFWVDWRKKFSGVSYLYLMVLLVSVITIGLSYRVGVTGGEIRHTEIRQNSAMSLPALNTDVEAEED